MNTLFRSKWTRAVLVTITLAAIAFLTVFYSWDKKAEQSTQHNWSQRGLEQVIEDWRVKSRVPGLVVRNSLPYQINILIASGESNVKGGIAVKENDQFRIASITKTFIAAEILRLAAEGKIRLDDPLNLYLPETPHEDVVSSRHLLSHRSGYFDPVHGEFVRFDRIDCDK